MPQQETVRITPEEIVNFILEEMEAGLSPTYYSNLVPSVYDVYLYIDDLERLRPLEQRMREEAVTALGERLSALNKASASRLTIPLGGPKKRRKRYEILGDWSVEFHENADEDARENPLVIHSSFPVTTTEAEDKTSNLAGTLTERVTKRRADGQTVTTLTQRTGDIDTRQASGIVYADLAYEDDSGAHTFQMTKDLLKIGRGSPDHWVDLKLKARKDVSREHLQIRRDPADGKLFIKDLSTLGTTVDGKRIPPSIQHAEGAAVDANIEVPLPAKARIGLAGVLFIDFKAVKQR
jgi:hypothetical protein